MCTKEKLIDLYHYILNGKNTNRKELAQLSEGELIQHIKSNFDLNVKKRADELFNEKKEEFKDSLDPPPIYEQQLVNYEKKIRGLFKEVIEQQITIEDMGTMLCHLNSNQSSTKDEWSNKNKNLLEILKKENQNLRRLILSYELMKGRADETEKKMQLRIFRQENEKRALNDKINHLNSIQEKSICNYNSQSGTLTQRNSMNSISAKRCALVKKSNNQTQPTSRKNSIKYENKKLKTQSTISSHNTSLSKPKRNRSALDITSISKKNIHLRNSAKLPKKKPLIKSYFSSSQKNEVRNSLNGKKKLSKDIHPNSYYSNDKRDDSASSKRNHNHKMNP